MLDFVRTKQKSILIKIAFGLIILSFIIGYTMLTAPSDKGGNQAGDIAARVNGDEISYTSFQNAYSNLYNLYQNIYQGNFDANLEKQLNLPKQAMQQLVEEVLLVQQADNMGIKVSQKELIDSIAQYDAFQLNGEFNRDRYLQVLSYQRMTPEQFEAAQRRQLLTGKVRENLEQGAAVTAAEVTEAFHQQKDQVNLNYVWLTPALVESKVQVSAAGLAEFFTKNIEQFRVPEKVSLRYLQFDPVRYENQIGAFTDDELERYYRRSLDLFEIKEQVKAAHILLRVPEDADEATITKRRELAAELLKQLKEGADFAQLAKTYSDDKSNADQGGDLGTFGRGVMVKEFEQAVFGLRPGQLSGVVTTPFGFHIIKVEEYTEPGVLPLVDAIDQVKAGLTIEKSRQLAYEKAVDAYNINRKTGDLEAAAKANDLGIKETGLFGQQDAIDGIGKVPEIIQAAFTLKSGELARPVQTTQGIFLFTLKERQPSRLPELDEVKPAVEQSYRAEQAQSLAHELANDLHARAAKAKDLVKAATDLKLNLEETGDFSRSFGFFIPRIGSSQELAEEAFQLSADAPIASKVYEINGRFLVAALKEAKVADFETLDAAEKDQLKEQLLLDKKAGLVSERIQQLTKQAEIEIFIPELVTAFSAGSNK
ncbi:MAG: SurA N-terminal domain-containing protein [Desulfuromonadales bacterium]|nr:SurA N-terminal domain-containing protein [Desulfuromonadales bacterium]MBN2791145.1 SurA N-terminal domain-containing protein [Desulfuromonadales bacterium]